MFIRCIYIISLLFLISGCSKTNHLDDTIFPVVEQWDTMQYWYDDNTVTLSSRNLDPFLINKRAAIERLAADSTNQNEGTQLMKNNLLEGYELRKENTDLYYEGVISVGNKSFIMNIAHVNKFKLTTILLRNDNFSTHYAYKNGICIAIDRMSDIAASKGAFVNYYVTHNWEREQYIVNGMDISSGHYYQTDNTGEDNVNRQIELVVTEKTKDALLQSAYLYLYLAEQLMNSNKRNCFKKTAQLAGTDPYPLDHFYYNYLRDYVKNNSFKIFDDPKNDVVSFSVIVYPDSSLQLIPSSIKHQVEEVPNESISKGSIDSFKANFRLIVEKHLSELVVAPAEWQCKKQKTKVRFIFPVNESPFMQEDVMTYKDE